MLTTHSSPVLDFWGFFFNLSVRDIFGVVESLICKWTGMVHCTRVSISSSSVCLQRTLNVRCPHILAEDRVGKDN